MSADYTVSATRAADADLLQANDAAWVEASAVDWGPAPWITRFRALATGTALLLRFDVYDDGPVAHYDQARRAHLGRRGCRDLPGP